ncbi:hypothetical protein ASU86_22760 [Enterobacter hormaechei subsp. steigerwaltii]|nr:hypothetical protein ASU86_22760 [Enterobacter hormaechei subsp. steigerwaltii]
MMSLWDALRMNMMISYQELVRTFPKRHMIYYLFRSNVTEDIKFITNHNVFSVIFGQKSFPQLQDICVWPSENIRIITMGWTLLYSIRSRHPFC